MKRFIQLVFGVMLMAFASSAPAAAQGWLNGLSGLAKAAKALTISDADMAQLVQASVAQMDQQNTVLPENDAYVVRLRRLTKGITDADGIPLNFKVYKTSDINAFACPDGSVRVYTGLMDLMTDDEVLGVVGHEIGHVVKRHSRNMFRNELLQGAAKDALAAAGGKWAMLSQSTLGALGAKLANAQYSRKQESEADDCGYDFLVKNGRNPYGMVTAFEKLNSMEQQSGQQSMIAKAFADHPDTAKRIANMEKRCKKDGYSRPVVTTSPSKSSASTAKASTSKKSTSSKKATTKKTTAKKSTAKKSTKKK